MKENKMMFYFSKGRLLFSIVSLLLLIALGALMLWGGYTENSMTLMGLALFLMILFSFFCVANVLKLLRGHPYIIITEEYIRLNPYTKSEAMINLEDIRYIEVSEVSFQKIIEIALYDEGHYFYDMSFHNKARLFMNGLTGFSLFTISIKVVRKQDRSALLAALDQINQNKNQIGNILASTSEQQEAANFIEKYQSASSPDHSINRSYFLKSYGYGLFIFALLFIFFYYLTSKDNFYLIYIIANLIAFPFAKVFIDWLFGFKLRHKIDKQKGVTYYLDQLMFIFDALLFHVSIFLAPIGIIFLLMRFIVMRTKSEKGNS